MPSIPSLAESPRRRPSLYRLAMVVFGAWFLLMLLSSRNSDIGKLEIVPEAKREAATFSAFPTLDGGYWDLSDAKGKVVLVNLWATWCPPCRAETPDLVRIAKDLKAEGLEVVGVSMDQGDAEPIRRFAQDYGIPYRIARGDGEPSFSIGVPLPTTMVFDRNGRLALRTVGVVDDKPFRAVLRRLLAERKSPSRESFRAERASPTL